MRQKLVAGNWKSNGSLQANEVLLGELSESLKQDASAEVLVCPPMIYLQSVADALDGMPVAVGAQNCSAHDAGAFTGEVTAEMVRDMGMTHVILGHSERRTLFGESDAVVAEKVVRAVAASLIPVLCIGETLEERDAGQAEEVCLRQLNAVFDRIQPGADWVIAYEPVWAIGTGKTASAADAQAMHQTIRGHLKTVAGDVAGRVRILYGGSVKADNAKELFGQADIDGALVGGASLKAQEFAAIIQAADS